MKSDCSKNINKVVNQLHILRKENFNIMFHAEFVSYVGKYNNPNSMLLSFHLVSMSKAICNKKHYELTE